MAVAIPALLGLFYWSWRVKQKLISQFVGSRLLPSLTHGVSPGRQKFRLALLAIAVAAILFALARPQNGFTWEEARQQGLDIMVAIDTSRSMLARDVAPNRLEKCKLAVMDLMRLSKSDRIGLVVFAGDAFLQAPLTLDEQAFQQSVDFVSVGIVPNGGTSLSAAIHTTLDAFEKGNDNHKVMVLFTDGDDHDADTETLAAAKEAAAAGMRIFTIGVGTPAGELIQVADEQGNLSFIKDDQGNAVKSSLNEKLLREIATEANGFYLPLQGATPMETLYKQGLEPLPKTEEASRLTRVYIERYHWFLGFAILCLILEALLPERPRSWSRSRSGRISPAVSAKAKVAAMLLFLLIPLRAAASPSSALKDFEAGNFQSAYEEFKRLAAQKTNDYRLQYDAGVAAYNLKKYDDAQKHFNDALGTQEMIASPQNQQQTYFNLGNTLYSLGAAAEDADKKKGLWKQAIDNYSRAINLAANMKTNDVDAQNNFNFVQQQIEQLDKQQQKDQDKDKDKDNEPSAAAKEAKARADAAVMRRQYKAALDIMEESLKNDPTTQNYGDYINRLREVNGVATNAPPRPRPQP